MKRFFVVFAAALAALTEVSCKHTPPPNVAADVNGYAITYTELDKVFQQTQQTQSPGEQPNEDQIAGAKLELLNTMITSRIVLQRAERLGLTAVDADVDAEFNKMKAPYTKEQFEARLVEKHMTADDLKTQIRHDLTINKLINKEITSHVSITDAEVANFFAANKAAFNHPEPTIRIAQILVTPNPDPNVRNLRNSKAQNEKQAKEKIEDLAARLQRGEDFGMLAQNYSEDPNSAANGGDMGPIPVSNLDKVSPELKKLVLSLQPGVVSPPIPTQYGFQILKVISREPAGQRELNDPRVQNEIRDTLINRKTNLLQAAFYEVARNESKVQNYLARSIVQSASK
jgi:peptidyl-prolyl cis-trans isomerase SurA